jgi:hypothetical protein
LTSKNENGEERSKKNILICRGVPLNFCSFKGGLSILKI